MVKNTVQSQDIEDVEILHMAWGMLLMIGGLAQSDDGNDTLEDYEKRMTAADLIREHYGEDFFARVNKATRDLVLYKSRHLREVAVRKARIKE